MTARELYEYALIEVNKLEAPSLLLEDYNYFINKAVQQYINLIYNRYDINQQSTDDLRVLKTSAILKLTSMTDSSENIPGDNGEGNAWNTSNLFGKSYIATLPKDYLHMLNCIVEYNVTKNFKCYNESDKIQFAARRLTSDMFSGILNNAYMRPMYKRPYYYINNWNSNSTTLPTNTKMDTSIKDSTESIDSTKEDATRQNNSSEVLLEIRFGKDDTLFKPERVYIDYLKGPMFIRLTQEQIDTTEDTSQVLEFPDYVCFEIVNIFTKLLLENASDPRLQTNIPINQTIASGIPQEQSNKGQ